MPSSNPSRRAAFPSIDRGPGLTKREYAAIHIFATALRADEDAQVIEDLAADSVTAADALFAELKPKPREEGGADAK